jgi:capsular polysaccharide biosynthesis protein
MEIRDIFRIVAKRWPIIVLSTAIALIVSFLIAYFTMSNVYEADTIMIISSPDDAKQQSPLTLNDYTLNTKLVDSYRVLCKTDRILNQVIQEAKLPLSTKQLGSKINVTAESDTEIIRITVQDESADTAAVIANAVASVFMREIPQIMKMNNVQVIDNAVPTSTPIKPDRIVIVAVAAALGLLLGFGICVLIEYLDVSVKSTEQLEKLLEAPVLGFIPHMQERDK